MVQAAGGALRGGARARETDGGYERARASERVIVRAAVCRVGLETSRWRE